MGEPLREALTDEEVDNELVPDTVGEFLAVDDIVTVPETVGENPAVAEAGVDAVGRPTVPETEADDNTVWDGETLWLPDAECVALSTTVLVTDPHIVIEAQPLAVLDSDDVPDFDAMDGVPVTVPQSLTVGLLLATSGEGVNCLLDVILATEGELDSDLTGVKDILEAEPDTDVVGVSDGDEEVAGVDDIMEAEPEPDDVEAKVCVPDVEGEGEKDGDGEFVTVSVGDNDGDVDNVLETVWDADTVEQLDTVTLVQ